MAECGCTDPGYYGPYLGNNCGAGSFIVFMSLVDAIIRNTCDISDVCGRVQPIEEPDFSYDFIVIGGGSGGSAVTGRLLEHKKSRVLLIEAGVDEPETYQVPGLILKYYNNPIVDWSYRTSDEPVACRATNGSCNCLRAKMLGGCSSINGMMFTRGTPPDFDKRWSGEGIKGWTWNDVLPFFRKFEHNLQPSEYDSHYHGYSGPVAVSDQYYVHDLSKSILKGAAEAGFPISKDINGKDYTGFANSQSYIKDGVRVSMAKAYLRPQRNNPHLHVMLNSTVTRILFDGHKKAYAVEFLYNNQTFTVKAKKEIILAAGTINSPKLLLQSGVGPKDALDAVGIKQIHNLPGVGQNLTNHVSFKVNYWINSTVDTRIITWKSLEDYLNDRTGPLSTIGITVTCRLPSKYTTADDPDIQMFFSLSQNTCSPDGAVDEPVDPTNPQKPQHVAISVVNLHTKSRGRITLKSKDPLAPPHLVGNYLTVKEDEDRIIDGIRLAQRLVNSTTLKDTVQFVFDNVTQGTCADQYTWDSDDYWRCAIRYNTFAENHQSSTLRMGSTDDEWSVVDEELRVIGLHNLRVADASAMPVVTSSNTNAPIVMLAERCADFIHHRWGHYGKN
ncbi:glucose dehydrogenase [FAD, quinone]-like [Diabrotica virgifera virgifera]|uniref:Glucose-methanol-choline oxidoreductase N-terminal domain-containing protein n=1 Tax=Diabrotica virgifera virgifera TaxID=50390 RepID=A0ABM5KYL5_DIAVI|nr:glucose dehydrogenase [FAD, quinone]-like [Diabrotica virgifera virgifera]XP_050515273.1 glucose dehydrogenase [FAD, quinone]-like [Diabrotica virgifera virgifera]